MEKECLWRWWSKGDPETGLLGFHTRADRDGYAAGKSGPFRRRVADDGRTIRQDETYDAIVQAMCEDAGIERRSQKQLN